MSLRIGTQGQVVVKSVMNYRVSISHGICWLVKWLILSPEELCIMELFGCDQYQSSATQEFYKNFDFRLCWIMQKKKFRV
jgi:hypothetical protein